MREMFRLDSIIAGLGVFALAAVIGVPLFGCGGGGAPGNFCGICNSASSGAACTGAAPCPTLTCGLTAINYVCQ